MRFFIRKSYKIDAVLLAVSTISMTSARWRQWLSSITFLAECQIEVNYRKQFIEDFFILIFYVEGSGLGKFLLIKVLHFKYESVTSSLILPFSVGRELPATECARLDLLLQLTWPTFVLSQLCHRMFVRFCVAPVFRWHASKPKLWYFCIYNTE